MAAKLGRWRENPGAFVREAIRAVPDKWQEDGLRDLRKHRRLSIAACHGVGKDALAAWAVLWVMTCWKQPKIPCTAPTSHQLYDLLWAEIAKWFGRMPALFRALFILKRDRFERRSHPETWFAAARTARKENSEALQGFHADVVLIVADEASGIPPVIFEVLEGAMTGPLAMMLLIGNPTQTSGYFYDSHHSDRGRWVCYRILAARAHDGSPLPPGVYVSERVSAEYVEAIGRKYGRDSNVYRVRVLGLFPTSEADQVILLEWLERARSRDLPDDYKPKNHLVLGLDVALFGSDDSALVIRQGPVILGLDTWHGHDRATTAGRAVEACKKLVRDGKKPRYIFVDGCGVGAGVVKLLRANDWLTRNGITVVDVQAGAKSPDKECSRLRDALWWRGRKFFDPGQGSKLGECPVVPDTLPRDLADRLLGELAAPKFGYAAGTLKVKVESKEEMRERGIGSPDLADAFLLTLAFDAGLPKPEEKRPRHAPAPKTARWSR